MGCTEHKTIFCDIDGTLVKHFGDQTKQIKEKPVLLDGTIEKLNSWDRQGYRIILVTGRRESTRKITKKQLNQLGIFYDKLIMGLSGAERVLINDRKSDGRNTAHAFNIDRNFGIRNIDLNESTRPWGNYETLLDSTECKVKKIIIKPGQQPSYQYHNKRSECWVVTQGHGLVTLNGEESKVQSGSIIEVPAGVKHRIKNIDKNKDLVFIEVQTGAYFGEDDIVRLEDKYGRD